MMVVVRDHHIVYSMMVVVRDHHTVLRKRPLPAVALAAEYTQSKVGGRARSDSEVAKGVF